MRAIFETVFDAAYFITILTLGISMLSGCRGVRQYKLFGWMAILLGLGDAFHLVPRAYALLTTGLEANAVALGIGKLITSVTMTIFYVMLYHIWRTRYRIKGQNALTPIIYILAAVRIALCLLPQNQWTSMNAPVMWGIIRNVPFALMGLILIVLFYRQAHKHSDWSFRWLWLAITLSFAFYIPVVLWADTIPLVGMLMIPKTLAYVWVVWMGYSDMKKEFR
ncbi:hypothetical protein [Hydrogenoanaerobacterium sp.]|uniref:hypothetical protein n=1 Tax=Hydrogenoanaerobacterium sp. TaxID=2953763 RepID=UPI0028997B0F|nr:hypothetical protein [Hydrogenoanaerobacterium sp.]